VPRRATRVVPRSPPRPARPVITHRAPRPGRQSPLFFGRLAQRPDSATPPPRPRARNKAPGTGTSRGPPRPISISNSSTARSQRSKARAPPPSEPRQPGREPRPPARGQSRPTAASPSARIFLVHSGSSPWPCSFRSSRSPLPNQKNPQLSTRRLLYGIGQPRKSPAGPADGGCRAAPRCARPPKVRDDAGPPGCRHRLDPPAQHQNQPRGPSPNPSPTKPPPPSLSLPATSNQAAVTPPTRGTVCVGRTTSCRRPRPPGPHLAPPGGRPPPVPPARPAGRHPSS